MLPPEKAIDELMLEIGVVVRVGKKELSSTISSSCSHDEMKMKMKKKMEL
jgi:hypothetical protein